MLTSSVPLATSSSSLLVIVVVTSPSDVVETVTVFPSVSISERVTVPSSSDETDTVDPLEVVASV